MKLNLQNIDTGSSILTNVGEAGDRGRSVGLSSYSTLPAQVCHKPNIVPTVQLRFQGKEEEEEEAVIITQGGTRLPSQASGGKQEGTKFKANLSN